MGGKVNATIPEQDPEKAVITDLVMEEVGGTEGGRSGKRLHRRVERHIESIAIR